ncbi:MAG TPA: hypothetical protein VNP72_03315, partial [Longimicrobium sp.]|nr:hypothetical protein [Longimicrobium sp.]
MSTSPPPDRVAPTTPWHFLAALDGDSAADRELLKLTRAYELEVVSNMALTSRVSILYSMSGNGKTSLVNAGVIPDFRERGFAVFHTRPRPPWCIDDPARAFRMGMIRNASLPLFSIEEIEQLTAIRGRMAAAAAADGSGEASVAVLDAVRTKLERIVVADPEQAEFRRYMEARLDLPIPRFIEAAKL